jgi:uncharacterized protein YfdQ (DUF2303 family)
MNSESTAPVPAIPDLVTAAADLGRRDTERHMRTTSVDSLQPLILGRLRQDERVDVVSLEKHLAFPLRSRGKAELHDPSDFAEYVNRLADLAYTTVWADPDSGRITALFDDHADSESPGWRSHTAVLVLKADPDWTAWLAKDNRPGTQAWFAEHIENLAHTVVEPDPATMLEIARTFDAKRNVNFRSGVRLDSGDVQLQYDETTKAKAGEHGQMDIPAAFTVHIAPFLGVPGADILARLRWRITDGELSIGYALLRPDHVRRDVVSAVIGELRAQLDSVPVYMGLPPQPLTAP